MKTTSSTTEPAGRRRPRTKRKPWAALRALLANLRGGMRAAFFGRVDARAWEVSVPQFIAVVLLGLLSGVALERSFYGAPAVFNWSELPGRWADFPIMLLVGWLAMRFAGTSLKLLTIPVALYAAALAINPLFAALTHLSMLVPERFGHWAWAGVHLGWYLWSLIAAFVLLRRTARLAYRQAALAILPLVALQLYDFAVPSDPLWYELPEPAAAAANAEPRESPVAEEMLYLQPQLARQALGALPRHRPGTADVYFLGYAPYAREDVFLKESEVIRDLMDTRFDARGRSLLLVNNSQTLRKHPLATVTNLRAALKRIGTRINPEEDVVVLYLTSHGTKDHRLSASYWPLRLEELNPALLRQLLDEAGIKWRVIAVSACYAGGFVEPLRSPTTLVMTAADATHTSFGCGSESDFTYFAKAVFDEQLRTTYSFEQAFERALPIIREREAEQGRQEEFSNPQIAVGEAVRGKLAELERRLAARR